MCQAPNTLFRIQILSNEIYAKNLQKRKECKSKIFIKTKQTLSHSSCIYITYVKNFLDTLNSIKSVHYNFIKAFFYMLTEQSWI